MSEIQLDRLRQDSLELQEYAQKLKSRGKIDLMKKILAKQLFLENSINNAFQ
jgi:phage shock protein A